MDDLGATGVADPRVRRYVLPKAIVWKSPGGEVLGAEELLRDGGPGAHLKYTDAAPGLVLDFGKELHGGMTSTNGIVPVQAPVRVRVRFGESVAEVMGEPNLDHAIDDQVVLVPWYGSTEIGNTGFRFVRIDLVEPGQQLELKRLQAVFLFRDLEGKGSFACNDERLNTIWRTGAYTVQLCMQEMLWGRHQAGLSRMAGRHAPGDVGDQRRVRRCRRGAGEHGLRAGCLAHAEMDERIVAPIPCGGCATSMPGTCTTGTATTSPSSAST